MITEEEEKLAHTYFERIMEQKQPAGYMLKLFCDVLDVELSSKERTNYLIMFNKYIRLYGREIAFLSLLDMLDMQQLDLTKELYPLFSYLCKKKFAEYLESVKERKYGVGVDLNEYIETKLNAKKVSKRLIKDSPFHE